MEHPFSAIVEAAVANVNLKEYWGRVSAIDGGLVYIEGLATLARIGDRVRIGDAGAASGEIIAIRDELLLVMPDAELNGLSPGIPAYLEKEIGARPCKSWIGGVFGSDGRYFDGRIAAKGTNSLSLNPPTIPAVVRKKLGARLNTGLAPFDTFLPICRGQRIGLFAGSGVGKSTLIGEFAKGIDADIVVVALIGERSREVNEFVENTLGPEGMARAIVFASTCDEPAPSKRRCALLAITTAEYFRDQGLQVLLLFDSITRFADAHREIALTAGETPSLRAYPPSTFRAIASLAERTGPGGQKVGDITAIFSVLVAGSDMDEPVADMVRGILDGHVILDRDIAERGRFPAVNIRRSVSRSLPRAASEQENTSINLGRSLIAVYDEAAPMIQTGLYATGSDSEIDRAIELWPAFESFMSDKSPSCANSFEKLYTILAQNPQSEELDL